MLVHEKLKILEGKSFLLFSSKCTLFVRSIHFRISNTLWLKDDKTMSKDLVLTKCILDSKVLWCRQRENYGRIPEILVSDGLVHLTGLLLVWLLLTLRTLSSGIWSCVHILCTVKPHFEIFFPSCCPPHLYAAWLSSFLRTYLYLPLSYPQNYIGFAPCKRFLFFLSGYYNLHVTNALAVDLVSSVTELKVIFFGLHKNNPFLIEFCVALI